MQRLLQMHGRTNLWQRSIFHLNNMLLFSSFGTGVTVFTLTIGGWYHVISSTVLDFGIGNCDSKLDKYVFKQLRFLMGYSIWI